MSKLKLVLERERDDVRMLMACSLVMFNSDHHHHHQAFCPSLSPRISFSSDFLEDGEFIKHETSVRSSPEDSNFEFSVSNHNMLTADQLFYQGRILPFKGDSSKKVTLKDELSAAEGQEAATRPPKGSRKWKKILGFKKSHNASKKPISHLERVEERAPFQPDIDVRDERKIWGWREDQSSYGWCVRDKRDLEEEDREEGEQQEDD